MTRVAILIACHNRRELTLNSLNALMGVVELSPQRELKIFLLDDASVDGTGDAVRQRFPSVVVIDGNGNLFWNRGMCAAYAEATNHGPWDTYVLMNDDLNFIPADFLEILSAYEEENLKRPVIMVGPVASRDGKLLYGGYRLRSASRPLAVTLVTPQADQFVEVDTMNANLVLVPGPLMTRLGGLDPAYHHSFGDIDLGYRARRHGAAILLYSRVIGTAPVNPPRSRIMKEKNLAQRLKYAFAAPNDIGQYTKFVWEHGPAVLFPIYLVNTMAKRLFSAFFPRTAFLKLPISRHKGREDS